MKTMLKMLAAACILCAAAATVHAEPLELNGTDTRRLSPGHAEGHDTYHPVYEEWENQNGEQCCNGQDCTPLAEEDVKEVEKPGAGKIYQVRIEGEWCPVESWMYLRKGNAPDWSKNHGCVLSQYAGESRRSGKPCDRFICFQPKPGS